MTEPTAWQADRPNAGERYREALAKLGHAIQGEDEQAIREAIDAVLAAHKVTV